MDRPLRAGTLKDDVYPESAGKLAHFIYRIPRAEVYRLVAAKFSCGL
jgi:hypothetical protein